MIRRVAIWLSNHLAGLLCVASTPLIWLSSAQDNTRQSLAWSTFWLGVSLLTPHLVPQAKAAMSGFIGLLVLLIGLAEYRDESWNDLLAALAIAGGIRFVIEIIESGHANKLSEAKHAELLKELKAARAEAVRAAEAAEAAAAALRNRAGRVRRWFG